MRVRLHIMGLRRDDVRQPAYDYVLQGWV